MERWTDEMRSLQRQIDSAERRRRRLRNQGRVGEAAEAAALAASLHEQLRDAADRAAFCPAVDGYGRTCDAHDSGHTGLDCGWFREEWQI